MTKLDDGSKVCVSPEDGAESAPICVGTSSSRQKGGQKGSKSGGTSGGYTEGL
jgi:hypothetical protein